MKPMMNTYLGALLNKTGCFLSSCICKSFMRQVFNRPGKINIGSVLLALLFICPWINRALGPWPWLRGLGFPRKGTFLQASSIQFSSLYDVFTTGQFFCILTAMVDCPLTICSTWKSPLLVRMQQLSSNGHWLLALFWCRLKTFS